MLNQELSDAGNAFMFKLIGEENFRQLLQIQSKYEFRTIAHCIEWLLSRNDLGEKAEDVPENEHVEAVPADVELVHTGHHDAEVMEVAVLPNNNELNLSTDAVEDVDSVKPEPQEHIDVHLGATERHQSERPMEEGPRSQLLPLEKDNRVGSEVSDCVKTLCSMPYPQAFFPPTTHTFQHVNNNCQLEFSDSNYPVSLPNVNAVKNRIREISGNSTQFCAESSAPIIAVSAELDVRGGGLPTESHLNITGKIMDWISVMENKTEFLEVEMFDREESGSYKCRKCPYRSPKRCNLTQHFRVHTNDKPFKCNICQRRFSQKSSAKTHILSVHKYAHELS